MWCVTCQGTWFTDRFFYTYDSNSRDDFGIIHAMKIDERCLPYAEEMKTCGYCAEGVLG